MTNQNSTINPSNHPPPAPLVGAIRWDAWHGARGPVGLKVEETLGPQKYHFRLPYFARVLGANKVEICGDRQEVMDQEIAYACRAGIDYWAFVAYEPDTALYISQDLFLRSQHKKGLKFCLVTEQARWGTPEIYRSIHDRWVALLCQPSYQKVLGDRPLLYLGFVDEAHTLKVWGSWKRFAEVVQEFRATAARAGLANPYIVLMPASSAEAGGVTAETLARVGADAVSAYSGSGGSADGSPFADSRRADRDFWQRCLDHNVPCVPFISFGWDPRPRIDTPTPWCSYSNEHYRTPTAAEAADHLADALQWTKQHRRVCPAQAVIIYAWNENDEGGWIVPTLNPDGTINDDRVKALAAIPRDRE